MNESLSVSELAQQVSSLETAVNLVWMLVCGFLVMSMQSGFAMVETGLVRAKNAAHTMGMNFLVYSIALVAYWAVGFGLQMGGVGELGTLGGDSTLNREFVITVGDHVYGVFGMKGFFLPPHSYTSAVAGTFLFQGMFAATGTTIPTGALTERWRFGAFVAFSVIVAAIIYPVYANWVWGGGFLSALGREFHLGHGHVDFAGSSVVHMTGGIVALVAAKMLGPRIGKYASDGTPRPIPGHNLPMTVQGTFVLALGWFGFNAGSTLSGTDVRISVVAVNTMLAGASGAIGGYLYTKWRFGVPDLSMMCNALLAGLVAITAPCAFVGAGTALLIGAIASVLVVESTLFVERTLKVDDPVGAVSVHGVNGTFGILALGLFADGSYGLGTNGVAGGVRGLFYGDAGQLGASLLGIAANVAWTVPTAFLAFTLVEKIVGNRPDVESEYHGLDVPELGMPGYSGDEAVVDEDIVTSEIPVVLPTALRES